MKRTEETVKVEGEFSYDNGFGDVFRQPVCLYWLIGIQNVTEDEGGANGFYPCEGFDVRMKNVLKAGGKRRLNELYAVLGPCHDRVKIPMN